MRTERRTEFDVLRQAVQEVFDLDIKTATRERDFVNARIIFSFILWERGYNKSEIGRYLDKNHATICHYCKNFDGYIKTDPLLQRKYEESKAVYLDTYDPVYTMQRTELKNEVFALRKKISDLNYQIEELRIAHRGVSREANRMNGILKLISHRTPIGSEKEMERKLNTWFNGCR